MQREEEAREQLSVDVEADPDGSDRDVAPAQDGSVGKGRPVEHAVHETRGDEEPGGAVQRPPALVAAEHAANVAHARHVSHGEHEASQGRRHHRLPARQDRPQRERSQPDRSDRSERSSERRAVWTRRQQDVRRQQDQAGDRHAAMPDRGPVDPVEPLLDPRQGADEHETDRQQQDRFAAEKLPEVAPGRLARGPRDEPQDAHADDEDADRRRPDISGDESTTHVRNPSQRWRLDDPSIELALVQAMHPKPDTGACASPRGGLATPAEH